MSEFTQKILLSCPYFIKKRPFQKNTLLSPIFCKKMSIPSKTQCSRVIFQNFHVKPCCNVHIWSTNVNSVKITLLFRRNKSIGCSFFQLSRKNYCSYAHIMSKKLKFSKKHCSHTHILSKNVYSPKNTAIPCHFFI